MGEVIIKFMDEADLKRLSREGDAAVARLRVRARRDQWWRFWRWREQKIVETDNKLPNDV